MVKVLAQFALLAVSVLEMSSSHARMISGPTKERVSVSTFQLVSNIQSPTQVESEMTTHAVLVNSQQEELASAKTAQQAIIVM